MHGTSWPIEPFRQQLRKGVQSIQLYQSVHFPRNIDKVKNVCCVVKLFTASASRLEGSPATDIRVPLFRDRFTGPFRPPASRSSLSALDDTV
ncbi:hypothetical protein J6590_020075 [Homalodisca vitripennis]|nr:hypothetical protein J6590_020075 [Homalodisca vitripennis]